MRNSSLLDLPRELRDHVYNFALDYPDLQRPIEAHREQTRLALSTRLQTDVSEEQIDRLLEWTSLDVSTRPKMHCPTILLLNKQITEEASEVLNTKCLNITSPVQSNFSRVTKSLRLTDFISAAALSRVRLASITLSFTDLREANNWWSVRPITSSMTKLNHCTEYTFNSYRPVCLPAFDARF